MVPPELGSLTELNILLLYNNNISVVPSNLTTLWKRSDASILLNMQGNPSVCVRMFDSLAHPPHARVACDCAKGNFGMDFCEPFSNFVILPAILVDRVGLRLAGPALPNGVYAKPLPYNPSLNQDPTTNSVQIMQIPFDSVDYSISFQETYSSWAWLQGFQLKVHQPSSAAFGWTSPSLSVTASFFQTVSIPFTPPKYWLNPFVPASLNYSVEGELPTGLVLSPATGSIGGVVSNSSLVGDFPLTLNAQDLFTGESVVAAKIVIVVQACGPQTCLNGGLCESVPSPQKFLCKCSNASFTGQRCQEPVKVLPEASASDSGNKTMIDVVVIVVVAVLLALIVFSVIGVKIHQAHERQRHSKEYHIFIRQVFCM